MRFVVRLLPCLVICTAFILTGCASQNTKVADLQRENARLQADKQKLTLELNTLRHRLAATQTQAKHFAPARERRYIKDTNLAKRADVRREVVQKAIELAEMRLKEAKLGQPQAAADAELALRVAQAASVEEPPHGRR